MYSFKWCDKMPIKKEIKQYSNRRQININKDELKDIEIVYIYTENEMLQHEKSLSKVTTTITKRDKTIANLYEKIDNLTNENKRYDAVLKDVIGQYNNLIDDVDSVSWKDAILNRFKRVLNNHDKISRIETVKAIETTSKDVASDDDVVSDSD